MVQALIFTGIVQAAVLLLRWLVLIAGQIIVVGAWTNDGAYVWSFVFAVLLGVMFATFANKDWFHQFLRDNRCFKSIDGITKRTSYPSEWFSVFNQNKRYVVLHLTGGRRLYGWPFEWPDAPDAGHFVIAEPEWLLDNNQRIPLYTVERMLVAAVNVEMVEFERIEAEIDASQKDIEGAEAALVKLHENEDIPDDSKQ